MLAFPNCNSSLKFKTGTKISNGEKKHNFHLYILATSGDCMYALKINAFLNFFLTLKLSGIGNGSERNFPLFLSDVFFRVFMILSNFFATFLL